MSSLLLVIVGIGIFRMELFRSPEATTPTVGEAALLGIRVCFTVAILCFLLAAYFMYTERAQVMERWSGRALTELWRRGRYAMRWARAATLADLGRLRELERSISPAFTGRAISSLEPTSEEVDDLFIKHPSDVRRDQISRLRIAYEHLAAANLRVRSRLGRGGFFVGVAYLAVFLGFLMYKLVDWLNGGRRWPNRTTHPNLCGPSKCLARRETPSHDGSPKRLIDLPLSGEPGRKRATGAGGTASRASSHHSEAAPRRFGARARHTAHAALDLHAAAPARTMPSP